MSAHKIGLFFGSFNPVHIGHLILANHFAEYSDLDQVWMVITPHNPHKKKQTLLDNHHRYQLVQRAVEHYPKIEASTVEFDLPQPNYTVNTLAHLEERYPQHHFSLIMGEDNLKSFHKWKNYGAILSHHELYVYPRMGPNTVRDEFLDHPKIHRVNAPIIEISSTAIRKAIGAGRNIRPLLPEEVYTYLDEMNFYR
ncbi:nicotinate (nicotinamide) nucleotide adenylyltransferase [Croceiramulus getboli]|nr:nicotinate (nicotinamide) nucleotide adenylyltransferase [Flavobacteriaceae bacterium YJPT1-3]